MASISKTTTSKGETRYIVYWRTPEGRTREKWFGRKVDAQQFAYGLEADKSRGVYIDAQAGKVTMGKYMAQQEATRVGRRPSTVARDRYLTTRYILPAFGHRQVNAIRPVEVRGFIAGLVAAGLAPATVRKAQQLLAGCLEAACRDGLIGTNPARAVELPPIHHREMRALSPKEIEALAGSIHPRYRALVLTAAFTGCRFGELAALRTARLDLLHRSLRVEETVSEVEGQLHFGPPKTRASVRPVALPKALVGELEDHLANYPPGVDGLVFSSHEGGPLRSANFRHRHWTPAVRASVGEPCRFHDLRHSHAAMLIASGQHPKVIQARLGHASIKTTLDTYGHLYEGLDEAAASALDDIMAGRAAWLASG